ncbi:5-oxoprolinase subunit PxpB [Yeosuana sp. MJ-SS3]|uniref:5-oxoprolinase subunit PxpB n=1 Tax=Gilvirhabdus luticola TaxID=3079858 RepID=A0ABU3U774_9FLAO|nr:5-oxoprolinase subunit PxpB [Yeosuana sp. MJ-SS3]MDU8886258.1 5-oxoprolinase subunit PxpB [Yeosuana sp. MJ-SS3]
MANFQLTYKPFGDKAILIEWPNRIDENILKDILQFKQVIENDASKYIVEVNHAYNSILIIYKNFINDFTIKISNLSRLYKIKKTDLVLSSKLWKIPVCYDLSFGIDSEEILKSKNIDLRLLIRLHTNPVYTIYFIGFLPGFLYLGGLAEELHFPRKNNPRLHIKKGSVAIGENQTGIYPNESPGGWNIIGNSPIHLFNSSEDVPCLIKGGDKIKFYPVSLEEHLQITELVKTNTYQMESEVLSG